MSQEGDNEETLPSMDYIDNYLNLPVKIRGLVMTVDHILDMSGAKPPAPEVTCKASDE